MAKKFLDNLKGLFIVEEEAAVPMPPPSRKPSPKPPTLRKAPTNTSANPIIKDEAPLPPVPKMPPAPKPKPKPPKPKIKLNTKQVEFLLGSLEKANLEGLDYLEFKQSLEALNKMQMDEETRYKSAYAVASSMGANVHKLIQTADHYRQVLEKAKKEYEAKNLQKERDKVAKSKKTVLAFEEGVKKKKAQIEQLKKQIDAEERKMIDSIGKAKQEIGALAKMEEEFAYSYKYIKATIDRDVKNMREYLTVKASNPLDDPFDDSLDLDM
ncbi:MAG: hypothetical protein AB8H47_10620 [Bacteroidia bacterium]